MLIFEIHNELRQINISKYVYLEAYLLISLPADRLDDFPSIRLGSIKQNKLDNSLCINLNVINHKRILSQCMSFAVV